MGRQRSIIFYFFLCLSLPALLCAQDSHYWNLQYGTRSILLGGAVIGSVEDLGATYYNPGALALFPSPEFLLSAKVYQLTLLNFKNSIGEGIDLSSSRVEAAPSLLAGSFNLPSLENHHFGYSLLTRQQMKFATEARGIVDSSEIGGSTGLESLTGEVLADQNLKDTWAGLTWSYQLNERSGIGITQYFAFREQTTRRQVLAQSLSVGNDVIASAFFDQVKYKHLRLLWKGGIQFNWEPLTFGATITTPSIGILGWGSAFTDIFYTGVGSQGGTAYAVEIQEDVDASYRSPLSIGAGFSYIFGRARLHASLEWFNAVKQSTVMDLSDLEDQVSGETIPLAVIQEAQSVVNYGAGIEFALSERFIGYGSLTTDFSTATSNSADNIAISTWNIYHVNGGASFRIKKMELTAGINFSFGSDQVPRRLDFDDGGDGDYLNGSDASAKFTYTRIKFLFGFSFQI